MNGLAKLETFSQTLQTWTSQLGYQDLTQKAHLHTKANPVHINPFNLWAAFFKARFSHNYQFSLEPLVKSFSELGSYSSPKQIEKILELHFTYYLPVEEKETLHQACLHLFQDLKKWFSGHWHQEVQKGALHSLATLQKLYHFPSDFQTAKFLAYLGYPYASSIPAYQAFLRYSGMAPFDYATWDTLLLEYCIERDQLYSTDQFWGVLFGAKNCLSLPRLCQHPKKCEPCPLLHDCLYYKESRSKQFGDSIENKLLTENRKDQNKKDLISYLTKGEFLGSDFQTELIQQFPNLGGFLPQDSRRNEEDQEFYLTLKALADLSKISHSNKQIEEGKTFTSGKEIYLHFQHSLALEKQESFYILLLDQRYKIIRLEEISKGLLDQSLVHPREVFSQALQLRASEIVLIHNHPSGSLEPSKHDHQITRRLTQAGEILGVQVLDHIIISQKGYFSFGEQGLMQQMRTKT